jgi:hypothetical protein
MTCNGHSVALSLQPYLCNPMSDLANCFLGMSAMLSK